MNLTLDNLKHYCTEEGDCWLWNLSLKTCGYPQATVGKQPGVLVRRHVFLLTGQQINKGWRIVSTCNEKRCVNPAHLVQRTPGRILRDAYASGKRIDNYARKLADRLTNSGLHKVMSEEERAFIDEHKACKSFEAIAAEIGRSPSAVARYATGRTYRKTLPNASVFAWRP